MTVKLADVAKEANVSIATASIVLNNPDTKRISSKTKERVLRASEKLNYVPNVAAQSLVTNKSQTIGLIIPDIENPFFSTLAKKIEKQLREENYAVIMMNTFEKHKTDPMIIRTLRQRNVDGMIIALSSESFNDDQEIKEVLSSLDIPFVLVDRILKDFKANQVYFNNKLGGYLATKHLIDKGHKRIGHISTKFHAMTGYYRYQGYLEALKEAKIDLDETLIKYGDYTLKTGYEYAEILYNNGVTAIVGANDLIAFGVQKRLFEMGLNVPEDMSIVGYDNLNINDFVKYGLTSIDQNIENMAYHAVDILVKAIEGQNEVKEVILKPEIKIRKSVAEFK